VARRSYLAKSLKPAGRTIRAIDHVRLVNQICGDGVKHYLLKAQPRRPIIAVDQFNDSCQSYREIWCLLITARGLAEAELERAEWMRAAA
jgi:hypothetical protein